MATFQERLTTAMAERGISQAELSAMSGVPKSAVNQYLSGKFKPKQTRTYILAEALRVDPAWLMGYADDKGKLMELSHRELLLIEAYRSRPEFRSSVEALLDDSHSTATASVFRAAKSKDGTVAPSIEEISLDRLHELDAAPETNEDL